LNLIGKVTDNHYYNLLVDYIELNHLWDYVFFKGEIFNQDEIYNNTDLVIIPSKEESFSMVIIEAFSLKIPVISTKTGGAIGLITDGATGFLYEHNDIDHLTHLIVDLTENRNKITSVTDKAYEYVSQNYDIRITSKLIENLLAKL
jgi:glycosyltransferase involved in cell wall biosynthesis